MIKSDSLNSSDLFRDSKSDSCEVITRNKYITGYQSNAVRKERTTNLILPKVEEEKFVYEKIPDASDEL